MEAQILDNDNDLFAMKHTYNKWLWHSYETVNDMNVTMQNRWNNRISDGCIYAQIRKGLGLHLVTFSNHDTVPFLTNSPNKRSVCLRWNSLCLYLSTLAQFRYFS